MNQSAITSETARVVHSPEKKIAWSYYVRRVLLYVLIIVLSVSFAMPLIWMISTSLKTDPQVYQVPPIWVPNPTRFQNYLDVLVRRPFGLWFYNTMRYGVLSMIGVVVSSALVAYSFARLRWWGRDVMFFLCIATMMVPFQVQMIPLYIIFRKLGWIDSYLPLIVPRFFANAYFVFLLRQFFMTIPLEISDAARVDGCSDIGTLLRIILPLAKPALAVVALFQFMDAWNDYLGPLIYLNRETLFPLSLGLQSMRSSFAEALQWPYLMAASTMIVAPIILVFFVTQRIFVEGITLTGVKG